MCGAMNETSNGSGLDAPPVGALPALVEPDETPHNAPQPTEDVAAGTDESADVETDDDEGIEEASSW